MCGSARFEVFLHPFAAATLTITHWRHVRHNSFEVAYGFVVKVCGVCAQTQATINVRKYIEFSILKPLIQNDFHKQNPLHIRSQPRIQRFCTLTQYTAVCVTNSNIAPQPNFSPISGPHPRTVARISVFGHAFVMVCPNDDNVHSKAPNHKPTDC